MRKVWVMSSYRKNQKTEKRGIDIRRDFHKNWQIYLMILPIIVYFFVFSYLPMGGVVIAFKNYSPANNVYFLGLLFEIC